MARAARPAWSASDGLVRRHTATLGAASRQAPAGPAAVFVVGAAAVRDLPVSVPARDDPSPRAVGRAGAARSPGSADARAACFTMCRPSSFGTLQGAGRACRSPGRRSPRRSTTLDAVLDRVAAEYAETAGARHRARLAATRSTICAAISHLGPQAGRRAGVDARVLRVQLRAERRGARPAQPDGAGRSSTAGSSCADRSISSSATPTLDVLRVTDHKTGKNRSNPDLIVGGGTVLQPVLYSVAVEQGLGKKVVAGRLFYCTTAGGFAEQARSRSTTTRAGRGSRCSTIVDRAVEQGFLPAAPGERACTWCDFRPVCGPREEERVAAQGQGSPRGSRGAEVDAMTDHRHPDADADAPTRDRRRSRRHARRRSGGRHRQDHRARQADPARARDRPARDGRDRRRDVHREGRRRAEAAAARGARESSGPTRRERRRPGSARAGARDARRGARQHHPRVLRRSAARAAGRGARRSAVRRADRAAGRPAVRRARFAPGCRTRCEILPRACAARCAGRAAPSFGFGGGVDDGPIDRLRSRRTGAGRVARLPDAVAAAAVRSRARDRAACRRAAPVWRDLSDKASNERDNLFYRHSMPSAV